MKKVGQTSELLFGIYWWTWKTNNYYKNCLSGPVKNKIVLIFTMSHLKIIIIKKITCRYHYQNLDYMIYSSWDIELKLVILGHFYPPKNPKTQNFENEKNCWRYHHMTHVYQKSQSYDIRSWKYRARQTELYVILGHFLPF